MSQNPDFHVLIVAAGSGSRIAGTLPKQYQLLAAKPLLRNTIEAFLSVQGLVSLRVVIDPAHSDLYKDACKGLKIEEAIAGGAERSQSVSNALLKMTDLPHDAVVLVHDAARPLIKPADIQRLLEAMKDHEAATLAVPVSETLRKEDAGMADDIIDRTNTWIIQTPQAFRLGILKKAHTAADMNGVHTDDTSLVSALGIPVKLVEGSKDNIKITYPGDMAMAEKLMSMITETRTGIGYDVHAFESDGEDRKLMLCGVEVAHHRGLAGHSDADVGLHAITDALLGAVGAGDIGLHFPPSDSTFKNMDSAVFLQKALNIVREKSGQIQNIDVTLICEAPKIGPYRDKMQARIADILSLDISRVNIKATTTEKLGFAGRGEGIAAQAVATIGIKI